MKPLSFLVAVLLLLAACRPESTETLNDQRSDDSHGDTPQAAMDLEGNPLHPLEQGGTNGTVLLFLAHDCPISNRYAPEIRRIHERFSPKGFSFYLVYPVADTSPATIRKHIEEYDFPGTPLRDPHQVLVGHTGATVTPEAAVYNADKELVYLGRIDNWYADFGQNRPEPTTHELIDALEAVVQGSEPAITQTNAVGCYIPKAGSGSMEHQH